MKQQTRMFKTLGCLIITMTAVSFLLAWLDTSDRGAFSASPGEMLAYARAQVSENTTVRSATWREVEVLATSATVGSGQMLSGGADRTNSHFRILTDGRVLRLNRWDNQRGVSDKPGTILIEVCQTGDNELMTVAQSEMLRALVASLSEVVADGEHPLPIRLGEAWATVYNIDQSTVFELVTDDSHSG